MVRIIEKGFILDEFGINNEKEVWDGMIFKWYLYQDKIEDESEDEDESEEETDSSDSESSFDESTVVKPKETLLQGRTRRSTAGRK